jgi:hypothetical protein
VKWAADVLIDSEAGIAFRMVRGVASGIEGGRCVCRVVSWKRSGNGRKGRHDIWVIWSSSCG